MRMADYACGLHHIGIPAADLPETMLFYTELGFDVVSTGVLPDSEKTVVYMKLGDLTLKIWEEESPAGGPGSAGCIALKVNDIRGAYDFICSRGLNSLEDEIHPLSSPEGEGFFFAVEGPNRERIEFHQPPQ